MDKNVVLNLLTIKHNYTIQKKDEETELQKPHKGCLELSKKICWCLNDCIEERDRVIKDLLKKLREAI